MSTSVAPIKLYSKPKLNLQGDHSRVREAGADFGGRREGREKRRKGLANLFDGKVVKELEGRVREWRVLWRRF